MNKDGSSAFLEKNEWKKNLVIILFSPFARIDHANNLIGSLDSIVKSEIRVMLKFSCFRNLCAGRVILMQLNSEIWSLKQ